MKLTKTQLFGVKILFVLTLLGWFSYELFAKSGGITGLTGPSSGGCYCHTTSSNSATTLSITSASGSFKVKPGEQETFTVRVSNSSASYAGTNIAVKTTETGDTDAGSVSAGTGLQKIGGELTHNGKQQLSSGHYDFSFTWTAPTTPGTYYIRALGNAVNGNGYEDSGDQWNRMSNQTVTVPGLTLDAPTGSTSWCAGSSVTIKWTATGIDNVKIELSNNGGADYQTVIAASVSGSAGTYSWTVPNDITAGDNYKVKVSDVSDATTNKVSSVISIGSTTQITTQPTAQDICEGTQLQLNVSATGAGLVYQWYKGTATIPGANAKTYTKDGATPDDNGTYKVIVTGACGSPVTSNEVSVNVKESAGITQQPTEQSVCAGSPATFTIKAKGLNKQIQWKKDGTTLDGKTGETLTIDNATKNDEGTYTAVVTADCGSAVTSSPTTLSVGTAPAITAQPTNQTGCEGTDITLSVEATGTDLEYQWIKDGSIVSSAISASYQIKAAKKTDEGTYKVVVKNSCGNAINSNEVLVLINTKPTIKNQPLSKTAEANSTVTLYVVAQGSGTLSYQWKLNGEDVAGATDDTLQIHNLNPDLEGAYTCSVSNDCGTTVSQAANVQIKSQNGGPVLELTEVNFDFGLVKVGDSKDVTIDAQLTNTGDQELTIDNITIAGDNQDEIISTTNLPIIIPAGGNAPLSLKVSPDKSGYMVVAVNFEYNSNELGQMYFHGTAYSNTDLAISLQEINFSDTYVTENSEKTIELTNNSSAKFTVDELEISGNNSDLFSIISPSTPFDMESGAKQEVKLSFNPKTEGTFDATLEVYINGDTEGIDIPISAKAIINSVIENIAEISSSRIFPNPNNTGELNLKLNLISAKYLTVDIVDNLGQSVFSIPNTIYGAGENNIKLDLNKISGSSLSDGTYSVVIKDGLGINTLRIVLTK